MVSACFFSSYFYTDSLHEHSVFPGCLRRKQFFAEILQKMTLKGAPQWYCVALVCGGVLHAFPFDPAESNEDINLQFWDS